MSTVTELDGIRVGDRLKRGAGGEWEVRVIERRYVCPTGGPAGNLGDWEVWLYPLSGNRQGIGQAFAPDVVNRRFKLVSR